MGVSPGGTTPRESFCPGVERLLGSTSVLGWNDSRVFILSWDTTTPGESFMLMKRLQGSPSVLGWNESREVIPSWDVTTPGE